MSKFFVNKNDRISVDVFAWERNGSIEATHDKTQVPESATAEVVTFKFSKPSYADSTEIIRQSQIEGSPDVILLQDMVLRQLCREWSIKDEDGETVPVNTQNISKLDPAIARAAAAGVMQKIRL